MTSEELAKAITHHLSSLENRIINVGSKEFDLGKTQKIETKTIDKLLDEAIEQLDDLVIYLSFTRLKIQKLRASLDLDLLATTSSGDQQG